MRRRDFIALLSAAAIVCPRAVIAQPTDRIRRIGVLMGLAETDPQQQLEVVALTRELQKLGWVDGRNVRIDYRWGAGDTYRMWESAKELVRLQPDVIVAHTTPAVAALAQETRTIPIVFVLVSDPVGSGFAESWSRPAGNITGFTNFESPMAGKWLEALRQAAPQITQVALLFNPETAPGGGAVFLQPIEKAAPAVALKWMGAPVRNSNQIETIAGVLGRHGSTGILVVPDIFTTTHRELIISLALRHRLPAIYAYRYFVADGGLMSYGMDPADQCRQAASYVGRILRGATPAELPIQAPTKFELVLNLKTAKALGLTIPATLLARADEVIE